jgi:hypothetical protein
MSIARTAAKGFIVTAVAVLAITEFLSDLFPRYGSEWAVAILVVVSTAGAIAAFRRDSVGRAFMWLASLTLLSFLTIYDVLDALLDPFLRSDWPVAAIAALLVAWLESALIILVFADE